jgi:hypothetical protein
MDFVRYLHPRFAAAPALRNRMKRKILPSAFHWLDRIPRLPAGAVHAVERGLMAADRSLPVCERMVAFLREHAPDVLLVSPVVVAGSEQVDWIKAARACGIRSAVCIASWDNLTNKGLLRVEPDLVVVWNEAQKREAAEYHYVPSAKIAITGAQLFDRWFVKQPARGREAFCARVGLRDTRPFVLFTGSSVFISRSNVEVPFVRKWIAAIRASDDPGLRDVNILVRPHPYNCQEWESDPLADMPGVTVFPSRRYNPIDEENRDDFFDSLYHSAAVVGVNTSAMIEAAIVGRPVFSLLTDEFSGTQEGTIHFHHLLPENGGFLRVASSLDEHVQQLSDRLRHPADARAELQRFVAVFLRPHGIDRPATPIFADTIERLQAQPAPVSQGAPLWGLAVRPVVLGGAGVQAAVSWLSRPDAFAWAHRYLRTATHRTEKVVSRTRKGVRKASSLTASRMRRQAKLAGKQWQKSVIKPLRARMR